MKHWILRIELDGEWEQCLFATREEALTAFAALANDYPNLRRAVLLRVEPKTDFVSTLVEEEMDRGYVN